MGCRASRNRFARGGLGSCRTKRGCHPHHKQQQVRRLMRHETWHRASSRARATARPKLQSMRPRKELNRQVLVVPKRMVLAISVSACTWHSLFRVPRRGFARTLCGNRSVRAGPHDTPQRANLGSPPRLRPRRHARRGPTTSSSRVPHAPLRRHNVPPIFANQSNPHFRWGCFPRQSPKSHRPPPRPAPRLRPGALPMTDRHPPLGNTSRWWVQASRACPRRTWRTETDTKSPCSRPAPSAAATR